MKKYFTVGEAAKLVNMTTEALRHYDRIGLVNPTKKDEWTKYRYYTEEDIVRLNTVHSLQMMDLSLQEIKRVLEYDELEKIIDFLSLAEKKADEKIKALEYSKTKIQLAKSDYERKLREKRKTEGIFLQAFPERVIFLSDTLEEPTVENLWNYLSHFYNKLPEENKDKFSFEDLAGIYTEGETSRLFALCSQYINMDGLKTLPKGKYLCVDCNENNRKEMMEKIIGKAKEEYDAEVKFTVQIIIVSGILQWNYQIQVYLGE